MFSAWARFCAGRTTKTQREEETEKREEREERSGVRTKKLADDRCKEKTSERTAWPVAGAALGSLSLTRSFPGRKKKWGKGQEEKHRKICVRRRKEIAKKEQKREMLGFLPSFSFSSFSSSFFFFLLLFLLFPFLPKVLDAYLEIDFGADVADVFVCFRIDF